MLEGRYRLVRIGPDGVDVAYLDGRGRQTIRHDRTMRHLHSTDRCAVCGRHAACGLRGEPDVRTRRTGRQGRQLGRRGRAVSPGAPAGAGQRGVSPLARAGDAQCVGSAPRSGADLRGSWPDRGRRCASTGAPANTTRRIVRSPPRRRRSSAVSVTKAKPPPATAGAAQPPRPGSAPPPLSNLNTLVDPVFPNASLRDVLNTLARDGGRRYSIRAGLSGPDGVGQVAEADAR